MCVSVCVCVCSWGLFHLLRRRFSVWWGTTYAVQVKMLFQVMIVLMSSIHVTEHHLHEPSLPTCRLCNKLYANIIRQFR